MVEQRGALAGDLQGEGERIGCGVELIVQDIDAVDGKRLEARVQLVEGDDSYGVARALQLLDEAGAADLTRRGLVPGPM